MAGGRNMTGLVIPNKVSSIIDECKKLMSEGLVQKDLDIDELTKLVNENLQMFSNSDIGRNGSSRKNDLMSRPIIMYLWHLIKQGKIVEVESLTEGGVSGKFLLIPMYDDYGKPTLQALMPIVASSKYEPDGEYQTIRFVEKLSNVEEVKGEGKFIFRSSNGGTYVDKCIDDFEYLENLDTCRSFDSAWKITTASGVEYLDNPILAARNIITIGDQLYRFIPNPHGFEELNDPNMKKASDGYITQDIIIPIIRGIAAPGKFIYGNGEGQPATAYRASIPVSRFMALGSLFVSHDKYNDDLAKDPDNDYFKRQARVKEWDMIEGVERAFVEPYETVFPNEDKLKVLTLAIDMFIFTIVGTIAMLDGDKKAYKIMIRTYLEIFSPDEEIDLFRNNNTPTYLLKNTKGFKLLSYFISLIKVWEKVPYVNHKDLRRSHNVMYNLEFTSVDFNDAHGVLASAFASLPNGSDYTYVTTVPCRRKVNGRNIQTEKQMTVFKNHCGISAYILDDFDRYMLDHCITHFRGQFISQLSTIAKYNRKQINSHIPNNLVIAPDQIRMFEKFLKGEHYCRTSNYWDGVDYVL